MQNENRYKRFQNLDFLKFLCGVFIILGVIGLVFLEGPWAQKISVGLLVVGVVGFYLISKFEPKPKPMPPVE